VALTGAHGTGKTTLTHSVADRLQSETKIAVTSEVPRLFIEEINDPTFFQRGNNSFSRQTLIVARQIELEATLHGITVLLCDRTIVDHWAYTEILFPNSVATVEGRSWKQIVGRWLNSYSSIYRLPIEFPIELDGVREADVEFQREIDDRIVALYREFGRSVETISGAKEIRENRLVDVIRRLIANAET